MAYTVLLMIYSIMFILPAISHHSVLQKEKMRCMSFLFGTTLAAFKFLLRCGCLALFLPQKQNTMGS